ncbi:Aminoglycoside phosphotransferase [Gracilaria domingensis]|nr:Aminoglycoside phosphotransferase [Gracilaria domingensis]
MSSSSCDGANGQSASESHSPASDSDSSSYWVQYVRVLLLNAAGTHALLCSENGRWDLPYFVYEDMDSGDYARCCADFQSMLAIDSGKPLFTALVELLGSEAALKPRGYVEPKSSDVGFARLLWVEPHIEIQQLPNNCQWKDAQFVSSIKADESYDTALHVVIERVNAVLTRDESLFRLLREPRHQMGWHSKVCRWLTALVEDNGSAVRSEVIQVKVGPSCNTLKVNSSDGWFYLKAPHGDTSEIVITSSIATLFPEFTIQMLGVSMEHKAFVTREFQEEEDFEVQDALKTLAALQQASIASKDHLIKTGCPVRGPREMLAAVRKWSSDPKYIERGYKQRELKRLIPSLAKMLTRLQEFNLPLTLTHGDFAMRNIGFKTDPRGKKRMILFDFEYTSYSHPFFDLHEICEEVEANEVESYLRLWLEYEPMHRLREAYEIGKGVGWILKMWKIWGYIQADCFQTPLPVDAREGYLGTLGNHDHRRFAEDPEPLASVFAEDPEALAPPFAEDPEAYAPLFAEDPEAFAP